MILTRVPRRPRDPFSDRSRLPCCARRGRRPPRAGRAAPGHRPVRAFTRRQPGETERKRKWLPPAWTPLADTAPATPTVLLGDLNILDPGTSPGTRSSPRSSTTSTRPWPASTA